MVSILFILPIILSYGSAIAQEESPEINAHIRGKIPSIKITEWTPINITIKDAFGIDWDFLRTSLFPKLTAIFPSFSENFMRLVWPYKRAFPQPVQRFLGYTSLKLEPEIIEGNPNGWYLKVTPNYIGESNTGWYHNVTLDARTDDSAVDNSVVVGIKVTRIDTLGGEIGSAYIYVPVKAATANYVSVSSSSQTTKRVPPKSMVYLTFDIKNEGYYKDVFQFDIDAENDLLPLIQEQAITLEPGETQTVTLGVLTPEKFFDAGTPNNIDISVYSIGDKTRVHVRSFTIITEGFYFSPLIGIILAPIIIIIILLYFIFVYRKRKREEELFGKPEKPWNIPEERKHLEELKQKDKQAYEKERAMMEDEYQSALLWYYDHRQSMKQEQGMGKSQNLGSKVNDFFKKPEEKKQKPKQKKPVQKQKDTSEQKAIKFFGKKEKTEKPKKQDKPKKSDEKPEQKQELPKEKPEIIKDQYKAVTKKSSESERRRKIALEKIRRAQEKQKKKINK